MSFPVFTGAPAPLAGVPAAPRPAPQAAPAQAPTATPPVPAAQQFAAPPGAFAPPQQAINVGAMLAGATMGVTRYPALPLGNHVVEIVTTLKPDRTLALVAELKIVSSDTGQPGAMHSFYQGLQGKNDDENSAKFGAALSFIVRAAGFGTKEQLLAAIAEVQPAGTSPEQIQAAWQAYINTFFVKPGPVVGRKITVSVQDSGKRTKAKIGSNGQVVGGGEVIANYAWTPVNE